MNTHEEASEQGSGREGQRRTDHDTPDHELHSRTQYQANRRRRAATEGHADSDLLRAAAHGMDDDSVNPERGEKQSDEAERCGDRGRHALRQKRRVNRLGVDLVFTMVSTSYRHTAVGM